jgi:hypothetical protein
MLESKKKLLRQNHTKLETEIKDRDQWREIVERIFMAVEEDI